MAINIIAAIFVCAVLGFSIFIQGAAWQKAKPQATCTHHYAALPSGSYEWTSDYNSITWTRVSDGKQFRFVREEKR